MRILSLLIVSSLCLTACGPEMPPKVFPQGDPYHYSESDVLEDPAIADADKDAPKRRIRVPAGREERRGLRMTVTPQETKVTAGQFLFVSLVVRNTQSMPATIPYSSEKRFDLVVFADPDQANPVYVHSEKRRFIPQFREYTLGGGGNLSRVLEIPTTVDSSDSGAATGDYSLPLPPGKYWVWGTHEGDPFLAAGPAEIEVIAP